MAQFLRFDGITNSNKTRKDDSVDCTVLLAEHCLPRTIEETPVVDPDEQQKREEAMEEAQRQEMRRQHYQSMFGTPQGQDYQVQPKEQEQQPERKTDPRLAQLAKCLPPGMRI